MLPMVVVEDLHKHFPTGNRLQQLLPWRSQPALTVLRGVSLQVDQGEMLALLGANGVGKTSLLKMIATLLLPDSGRIRVCGYDAAHQDREVRKHVGYIFADERSFHWRLNGRENLEFFAALNEIPRVEARARIYALLRELDLLDAAERSVAEFSTGMKQRLAIARALLPRPRVLLMDEPTRSVDPIHAAEVWRLVRQEIQDNDGSLIVVTHQIDEVLALSERIAVLDAGRVAVHTTSQEMESLRSSTTGFSLMVRGLTPQNLLSLRRFPGVRDIRVVSQTGSEQALEVWTYNGDLQIARFISELTGSGAVLSSLDYGPPLQSVLERLLSTGTAKLAV